MDGIGLNFRKYFVATSEIGCTGALGAGPASIQSDPIAWGYAGHAQIVEARFQHHDEEQTREPGWFARFLNGAAKG